MSCVSRLRKCRSRSLTCLPTSPTTIFKSELYQLVIDVVQARPNPQTSVQSQLLRVSEAPYALTDPYTQRATPIIKRLKLSTHPRLCTNHVNTSREISITASHNPITKVGIWSPQVCIKADIANIHGNAKTEGYLRKKRHIRKHAVRKIPPILSFSVCFTYLEKLTNVLL